MNTPAKILLVISTAILGSCNAEADASKENNQQQQWQQQTAIILHQGIALGLEMEMQDTKDYRITRMTKKGDQLTYRGVVIAKSGIAYKASCDIQTMMDERFALPCELDLIDTLTLTKGEK